MPKIAIFMNSLAGGGMERAMLNLANFFVQQGANVDLLVASTKGPLLVDVPDSVNLIDLKSNRSDRLSIRWWLFKAAISVEPWFLVLIFIRKLPKAIKVIPALIGYLEKDSPDIILSTPTTANLALLWAKSYCGYNKKIVIREASILSKEIHNKTSIFFKLTKRFVRKWYNCADVVICVSDGVGEDLRKNFSVQKQKLHTIYNILDIDKIKKQSLSSEDDMLIRQYGDYVLSVGRLEKEKDYGTLIRAFHLIANDVSVNLVILGEGSERPKLEKLISELSLSHCVFLPGFFINPYPFIAKCEVFALSSKWEGCPNVLREALVLQRSIISTDCSSGIREILENGGLGELIEVGNVKQYSVCLYKLLQGNGYAESSFDKGMNDRSIKLFLDVFLLSM
jgi:glycosyltransferase involved in cell wall biosynthesis